jgi:hypothetical protein
VTPPLDNHHSTLHVMPQSKQKAFSAAPLLIVALALQLAQIGLMITPYSTLRLSLAGATLLILSLALAGHISQRRYHAGISALYAVSMLLSWVVSVLLLDAELNWNVIGIQLALPIYLGAIGGQPNPRLLGCMAYVGVGVVTYAAIYAVAMPLVVIDGVPRLAGFLETRAPHNSAYLIASLVIFFWIAGVRQSQLARWLYVPVLVVATLLIVFYQVRTAQVMLFSFFTLLAAPYLKGRFGMGLVLLIFVVLGAGMVAYLSFGSSSDLTTFSSGRTSVYIERLNYIATRDFAIMLLGSGPGTDMLYSDTWWWDAKNSHNDFLTTVIERGLIGLLLLLWYLIAICRYRRWETVAIIIAIVVTGLLSNGLFQRPLPLLFTALALWVSQAYRRV